MPASPRICVITSAHLSSCPRMVKAADALHEAGYRVRVVCVSHLPSHQAMDELLLRSRPWAVDMLRYDKRWGMPLRVRSGVSQRLASHASQLAGLANAPLSWVGRAYGRLTGALVRAAIAQPADLYYGGTAAALAATFLAAQARGVPFGIDLEDFHSAEQDDSPFARRAHAQIDRVERDVIPAAALVTAAGEAMADAYAHKSGRRPISFNNAFPLPATPPNLAPSPGPGLRLYWFSQTIGPGRGLEDGIRAAARVDVPMELHVRGSPIPGYLDSLRSLAAATAPRLNIVQHAPEPPDPIDLARAGHYDVGLALEQTHVFNRTVCLTNKSFTYLGAGLAVAFTDTPGQRLLARDLGEGAFSFAPNDSEALAAGLSRWAHDKPALARAKAATWDAAVRRWNWDHPLEKGALLDAVAAVVGPARPG